jgi:hypothetical protein
MAQIRGKLCWKRIKDISGLEIELDFDHPLLRPVPSFLDMLLRAHRVKFNQERPFILLVAEKKTLDKVPENINVTVIFLDMMNDDLLSIAEDHDIEPLLTGIKTGIVVNPRGLEPLGAKGVFEVVTGEAKSLLAPSTVKHTPWSRLFYPRKTTGPQGEGIPDLVEWVRNHWKEIVLKPVHGHTGRGIFIGPLSESRDEAIQTALEVEPYIVQSFIPKGLWAEEYPWLDLQEEKVILKQWQTDFRCMIPS